MRNIWESNKYIILVYLVYILNYYSNCNVFTGVHICQNVRMCTLNVTLNMFSTFNKAAKILKAWEFETHSFARQELYD